MKSPFLLKLTSMKFRNLVYFGSPEFSAQILASLLPARTVLAGVVTTPDKPLGRKQVLTPSPVAQLATKYDLPIFKPEKLDAANLSHLRLLRPDIFLIVSYGKFIPNSWLTIPAIGTFNLHFSLLPKYRGALCISEAIKNQEKETGVTLMVMDRQMDHGPLIAQEKVSIDINDNVATLTKKLTHVGVTLLRKYLPAIAIGKFTAIPQDEAAATYTPVIKTRTRDSALIPWKTIQCAMSKEQCALTTHALIRSLNPDPGAWTKINDLEVKLIQTRLTVESKLKIETIQQPGKSPISWKQFIGGRPGIH